MVVILKMTKKWSWGKHFFWPKMVDFKIGHFWPKMIKKGHGGSTFWPKMGPKNLVIFLDYFLENLSDFH